MNWQALLNDDIQTFIRENENTDTAKLALNKNLPEPKALILDQIKARQKAARKMPHWLTIPNLIFPAPNTIEQASSQATATYKASLFPKIKTLIDLTGGSGIDAFTLAQNAKQIHIIERDTHTAALLTHNASALGLNNATIHAGPAEDILASLPSSDLILIDPQRRTSNKRGLYKLEDCSPNIINLLHSLAAKTSNILLKTSPMLDIDLAIKQLKCIHEIHIIEHQNECKELLIHLKPNQTGPKPTIKAITLNEDGTPKHTLTNGTHPEITNFQAPATNNYLYEPGPAIQKAALHDALCAAYPITKIAPNTNLFTSPNLIKNFPGRSFKIIALLPPNKKSIPMRKANLTIRNFPSTVEDLRKKLNLKDGGEDYLFACTLNDGKKTLIHARKTT